MQLGPKLAKKCAVKLAEKIKKNVKKNVNVNAHHALNEVKKVAKKSKTAFRYLSTSQVKQRNLAILNIS